MELTQSALRQAAINALVNKANAQVCDIIVKAINRQFDIYYSEYVPSVYLRSYDLRNTPIKLEPLIKGDTVTFRVKFDSGQLHQTPWSNRGGSGIRHSWQVDSLDGLLADIVLRGNHGNYFISGRNMLEKMLEDTTMRNEIKTAIISAFRSSGFSLG